ncbi:hypothetical protein BZG36_03470 [Bifiguratus adelaidae]|uniref:ATP synthase subunit g, mitochondrial n=1 Tax=Bifiguratus adelaidae TaxID=1938954 RepID=A0A261XZJ4_9FUNG|nr:hypothetical protein BZG36_03470 [Bifiguratus adelaidae]
MSAQAQKVAQQASGLLGRLAGLSKPIVYNAKVVGELAKQVYTKEGMAFPTGQQFNEARKAVESINRNSFQNVTLRDVLKGTVYAAEVYTFFLIGEVVGRRNLVGYNVKSAESHH